MDTKTLVTPGAGTNRILLEEERRVGVGTGLLGGSLGSLHGGLGAFDRRTVEGRESLEISQGHRPTFRPWCGRPS